MVGRMLSHYRLVEKVGEGGMGVVWKAEDTILDRTVAIKVLPADVALDEERRQLFLNEARLAASLSHARIVQVYDLGRDGDLDFIVMEYVAGQPLSHLLHGHALPPEKVASLGLQIAEGLSRAHHKHLLHRDLKPANVLVTSEGEVKIVDFGLATLFNRLESTLASSTVTLAEAAAGGDKTRSIGGTLPYMSPEQVRGEKLDARSDIFSFGTVLYEMTTGRRPFQGSTPAQIGQEILRSQPTPVQELAPKVPLGLLQVIDKAMARKPEDRYQIVDDAAIDLRRLAKEIESGSSRSYADLRAAQPTSRTPARRVWILGGIGIAAIVVLAWLAASRRAGESGPTPVPTKVALQPERTAIAVLPFQNLSAEGPQAYFAGGLHDELLTQLAKVAALKVISHTSVMGYQGTSKPLKVIAEELGVGTVVEGSVQVAGNRLRVNVQLIDAATDEYLWAEHYDRTLDDAFAIQSDVAQQVVAAVGSALETGERQAIALAPTGSPEAYRLYLQAEEYRRRPGWVRENLASAQQLYERALALDPGFALAHTGLSQIHGLMFWFSYDLSPSRMAHQREAAELALQLAPGLPEAHVAMGLAYYQGQRDYRGALDEFTKALRSMPNDGRLWADIGYAHRRLGEWAAMDSVYRCAASLDPRNADIFRDLGGQTLRATRRYAEAVPAFDRALELAPDLRSAAYLRALVFAEWKGDLGPLRALLGALPGDADLGDHGTADKARADLLLLERKPAELLALVGRHEEVGFSGHVLFVPGVFAAFAHRMRGDESAARTAFTSALVSLDTVSDTGQDGWKVHAERGLALAALGRRADARREIQWLEHSDVVQKDAWVAPEVATSCALILTQLGEVDDALDRIERLLSVPKGLGVHMLRLDPRWDPIRDHPRFKTLLAKYAEA